MPANYSWPLLPDATQAAPPPATSPGSTPAIVGPQAGGVPSFLGQGLVRPFRRDQRSDFANAGGRALVKACVGQVLGTRADSASGAGELPWRTEFGSRLHLLRHRNQTDEAFYALAVTYTRDALQRWEPRAVNPRVQKLPSNVPTQLMLKIGYDEVDANGRPVAFDQSVTVAIPIGT